jgi:hypothetical protein
MVRRWVVASSISLLATASHAQADWADWRVYQPGPLWVFETGNAPSGPQLFDRCYIIAVTDFVTANNSGQVWCNQTAGPLTLENQIDTLGFASVAMDAAPTRGETFTPPSFAVSDPARAQIWYGVAGQAPELALEGNSAMSLSLAHFSDGAALLVYRGGNNRLYTATRKPTGQWSEMQLTNNSSGNNRWSVDAVIQSDVVHIAYWDDDLKAVRYARKDASGWTFETVKDLASAGTVAPNFVAPAVAADDAGGAHVGFSAPDGLLHYLRRIRPGAWAEHTFAPPLPVTSDDDRGPVGFTIDQTRNRAHFVYGTGNGSDAQRVLRYVNVGASGVWRDSTVLSSMTNNPDGYRGIDLVLKVGPVKDLLLASWAASVAGILELGCADCIE